MLYALQDMQSGLADDGLATSRRARMRSRPASSEISMGNLDLSQRTEQQAMALERTATQHGAIHVDGAPERR